MPALVMLPNDRIDPLFRATIKATEESVVNPRLAAQTMTGVDGIRVLVYEAIVSCKFCGK